MPALRTNSAVVQHLIIGLATAVVMASGAVPARAQDASEFHELETNRRLGQRINVGASLRHSPTRSSLADLWYLQHHSGVGFNTFTGDAVFLGPLCTGTSLMMCA
jgi:hypothetical protein